MGDRGTGKTTTIRGAGHWMTLGTQLDFVLQNLQITMESDWKSVEHYELQTVHRMMTIIRLIMMKLMMFCVCSIAGGYSPGVKEVFWQLLRLYLAHIRAPKSPFRLMLMLDTVTGIDRPWKGTDTFVQVLGMLSQKTRYLCPNISVLTFFDWAYTVCTY